MIDFHLYCQIRALHCKQHLSNKAIAENLQLDLRTVSKWAKVERYAPRKRRLTTSVLDPYKPAIAQEVALSQCSAQIVFRSLVEDGYTGGLTIVKDFVHQLRIPTGKRLSSLPAHWMMKLLQGKISPRDLVANSGGKLSLADAETLVERICEGRLRDRNRAMTVLANMRGISIPVIVRVLMVNAGTVRKNICTYQKNGVTGLFAPRKSSAIRDEQPDGQRRAATRDQKARRILEIVHAKPSAYGINRSNWNRPSIARAYEQEHNERISVSSVGELLGQSGYSIRKARKVLTSPDPDYREKVELLLNTLQNLKPGELFFFVDEMGPLRVKKYGGRALVRKNEVLTYPQVQAHRGVIMMSGALSATSNQVTWVYGRAKDTAAMIDLLEVLYNQYFSASKLYVTWDAVSWHKSAMLVEWLDAFNSTTKRTNEGPLIELVPLPTSSQFLDVIEAVFSGMKRAVVHHSDYRDAPEMKTAISRHFTERNAHFRENPRRAGKQIWEVDFFDNNENIRSGNYREW